MSLWPRRLLILAALFFLVGWGLVLVSEHGGNSTGGSEAVWRIGGVMVYASVPLLVIAAVGELAARFGSAVRSFGKRS
jgi:hypothetical protein